MHGSTAVRKTFDPRDLNGCVCWLRSDQKIELAAGKVAAWRNLVAGSSGDCTQATAANQPAYNAGLNGMPKLSFDGAASVMNWALSLNGPKTVCAFVQSNGEPGSGLFRVLWAIGAPTNAPGNIRFQGNSGSYPLDFWADDLAGGAIGGTVGFATAMGTKPQLLITTYNGGTNTATASYTASRNDAPDSPLATGSTLSGMPTGVLGSDTVNSRYFNGDFYEIMVFGRVLQQFEQDEINGYTKARYGL